jgi:hypothetical protein
VLSDGLQARVGDKVVGVLALTLHDDGRVDTAVQRPAGVRQAMLGIDAGDPYERVPPLHG